MYHLHFNESTQEFCIIPTGVTITEAYDGVEVLRSESLDLLMGVVLGLSMHSNTSADELRSGLSMNVSVPIKQG